MNHRGRSLLAGFGGLVVLYCIFVLGFVATSPDVRLRFLLVDEHGPGQKAHTGIVIRATPQLQYKGELPTVGDSLVRFMGKRIDTFADFTRQLMELRNASIPPGGQLYAGGDPSEHHYLPPLVEDEEGHRYVKIAFIPQGESAERDSWLLVQSVPWHEIALSFVWFILELGIFIVGGLAFWYRPFDRSARLFFAMCIVTLGAFVGGYHWWVIAGSLWLNFPFVICAMLVPVISLHFFLVYPRPHTALVQKPGLALIALYTVPGLSIVAMLGLLGYSQWLNSGTQSPDRIADMLASLRLVRHGIYSYLAVAALYFAATLLVLRKSYVETRNPIEHDQLKWIWWAGVIASIPLGIALYLAHFDRTAFALGEARVPMFLASLSFMLAYAVGIVRYKLMLVDQIVSKGMLFYVMTYGLTLGFAITVAVSSLVALYLNISLSPEQAFSVAVVLSVAVILLLWLRDRVQQGIDRRFFREKYQLGRALQQMNEAVGHLVDRQSLAQRMLGSCRDVLRVGGAALYLRDNDRHQFRLVSAEGVEEIPMQFTADDSLLQTLNQAGTVQRVTLGSRNTASPVQVLLRNLRADLLHALEMDGEIAGFVALFSRLNGGAFTAEDVTFLNAMGQITGIALHCAKVHQDVGRLNEELRLKVEKISDQNRQIALLQAELAEIHTPRPLPAPEEFRRDSIKGNSPAMQRVLETVRKVATSSSSVLIRGESGTGKELIAQAIHENSPRRNGPMIRVHCAALSPSLLESELFGHVKGAFTGAQRDRVGRFEMANGGTLFLDEIGDISLETQIKLLRVLQERCFEPVGSTRTIEIDVRLITATHQNLEKLIRESKFREDLFYRLNVITISLPPLRERKEDIFELAAHFLNRSARRVGKRITHIDEDAIAALERYDWSGNIRELENVIERAVVLAEGDRMTLKDLPAEIVAPRPVHVIEAKSPPRTVPTLLQRELKPETVKEAQIPNSIGGDSNSEREILKEALEKCDGNKARAARLLGIPRSTYYSKLKKFDLS